MAMTNEEVMEKSNPSLSESLKEEAMPNQENQVHSVEWAETLVWAQATSTGHQAATALQL